MNYVSIWMGKGFYWDPQIRGNQEKMIRGPFEYNETSYYAHTLLKNCHLFSRFLALFLSILFVLFGIYGLIQASSRLGA